MANLKFINLLFTFLAALALGLSGCSQKLASAGDFGKSDAQWLAQISEHIRKNELERADEAYMSLYSEHIASRLLGPAALMLARAHAAESEYKLANYFMGEFGKLFGSERNRFWSDYISLRNDYYALSLPQRNQKLLLDTISRTRSDKANLHVSPYAPLVKSILTRLEIANYALEQNIAKLYERMGYAKSAQTVRERNANNAFGALSYIAPELPWYRKYLE